MIQDDLNELYSHVWWLAGVTKKNMKLSEQAEFPSRLSSEIASIKNHVKGEVYDLRDKIHESNGGNVSKPKLVEITENLQEPVCNKYCKLIENVTYYCISLKPEVPCKFTLIIMGSLAKKKMRLCSDFEHAIVLQAGVQKNDNYQEILEYFRFH